MVCCMSSLNVMFLASKRFKTARILIHKRLRDHDPMSRALMELHWLPRDKNI